MNPCDESPPPSTESAREPEKTEANAIGESPEQSTVMVGESPPIPVPERDPVDPDDALRAAIKAALDAGDLARAGALLDVLRSAPKPAPVVVLEERRKAR